MASSGTIKGGTYGNGHLWLTFEWSQKGEQNISGNSTTIDWSLKLNWDASLNFSASKSYSISVNGTNYSGSYTSGASGSSGVKTLRNGSTTIAHSGDGSKSFSVSTTFNIAITWSGSSLSSMSLSGSGTLNTIPRASTISMSAGSAYPNAGITVNISRASSSFTHTITWNCGDSGGTIGTGVGTSMGWTVPANLIDQAPNYAQTVIVQCYTYNGSTLVGTSMTSFIVPCYSPSTISGVSGNMIGSSFGINISRASGLFTHSVWYSFGSISWESIASGATTSASFTPPMSLCNQIPNSASGSMTIIVRTYYGGTQIGADQYYYYTMYVPSSVVPSFSGITCIENVSDVATKVGAYVQNKSQLNLSITGASGTYSSTIKTYKITIAGYTINAVSGVTSVVTVSGNQTITAVITDSRGRTETRTMVINILPYTGSKIANTKVSRTTDTTAIVSAQLSASSLLVLGTEKNSLIYKIEYKKNDDHSYTVLEGTYNSIAQNLNRTMQQLDPSKSYEFKVTVGDVFGYNAYEIIKISTAFKSFDFDVEKGRLGIKKILEHEDSVIEVPDDSKMYVGSREITLQDINKWDSILNKPSYYNPSSRSDYYLNRGAFWTKDSGQSVNDLVNDINFVYTAHGAPVHGVITTFSCRDNTNYRMQIITAYGGYGFYYRTRNGDIGEWTNWKRLANSDDSMTPSNHNHNYATWVGSQYASGSDWFGWYNAYNGSRRGYIQHTGKTFNFISENNTNIQLTGDIVYMSCRTDGIMLDWSGQSNYSAYFNPISNGRLTLGTSANRWFRLYQQYGSIDTSDEREKHNIQAIDNLYSKSRSIKGNIYELLFEKLIPKIYCMNNEYSEYLNDEIHIGFVAQDIAKSLKELDIEESEIGIIDHEFWTDKETGEEKDTYGLCYTEFIALNTHMIQKLYKNIDEQAEEINDLKEQVKELKEMVFKMTKNA